MQHSTCLFFAEVADFDYLQLLYLELLLFNESLGSVSAEQLQLVKVIDPLVLLCFSLEAV